MGKSDQTNIGLDLSLFNDRVTVGMDYFIKNTKDLLYDRPLHTTTGFSSITQNIGSMRNTGFEFNVESHNIMNDRFSWGYTVQHLNDQEQADLTD